MNVGEGYYYVIPAKWVGKIAVLRDTENALTEIYRFDSEENISGERLLYIKSVKKSEWDEGVYKKEALTEIVNNGETSFVCHISDSAKLDGISIKEIKNDLKLY